MLILFLRVLFAVIAVLIGQGVGGDVYPDQPWWFGGMLGFAIAVTLIAAEQGFKSRFTRSLIAVLIGLAAGLALSALAVLVLRLAVGDQSQLYRSLALPLVAVVTYLVLITVLRNADRFRVVVPFVEFRAEQRGGAALVLAADALADARLLGALKAGLAAERLIVHQRVVAAYEAATSDSDIAVQARARRALDGLAELRALGLTPIDADETDIPNASDVTDVLLRLARLESARVVTADADTLRRAKAQAVAVLDLAAMAAAMLPAMRVGDRLNVLISKPGEARGQGVGTLDDGSLVVVAGAAARIGQTVTCTIVRLHATHQGRMLFAELVPEAAPAAVAAPAPVPPAG